MMYEDFLELEKHTKSKWEDGFNSKKYRRYIKFASIRDKIWKTRYLSLEAPKETPRELTTMERKEIDKVIEGAMKKTYDARKKMFYERRREVLKKLEKEEIYFKMDTTINKLEEYMQLKLENAKNT